MKERIFMSQTTLIARLYAETPDDDVLSFLINGNEEKVYLNSDSCQAHLKEVFSKLITISINEDVQLQLKIDDDYGRGLYKDVCTEYIQELQNELDSVKERIRRELAD